MTEQHSETKPAVTITSDGAARGNPGPGGWAAWLEIQDERSYMISGGEEGPTTNNAMELEAVIQALKSLQKPSRVLLRLDSQYVLGGIEQLQAGTIFSANKKNGERWNRLVPLLQQHTIRQEWVRGHNGDARNERVDRAANDAANGFVRAERPPEPAAGGAVWQLAVLSPGSNRHARWALRVGETTLRGEVGMHNETQATVIYRALLAGMRAAQQLASADVATLDVITNFELLVKQANGEWRVKNPSQQPLAAEATQLRAAFGGVQFRHAASAALEQYFSQ